MGQLPLAVCERLGGGGCVNMYATPACLAKRDKKTAEYQQTETRKQKCLSGQAGSGQAQNG